MTCPDEAKLQLLLNDQLQGKERDETVGRVEQCVACKAILRARVLDTEGPQSALGQRRRFGPYEIIAPLGKGGMGEVYRARDTRLGREVAVKILPELFALDPKRLLRFKREARAVAARSRPNILAIHDYGTDEKKWFSHRPFVTSTYALASQSDGVATAGPSSRKSVSPRFRAPGQSSSSSHHP